MADVLDLLREIPSIDQDSVGLFGDIENGNYYWGWDADFSATNGAAFGKNGVLSKLQLGFTNSLSLEKLFTIYGEPAGISTRLEELSHSSYWLVVLYFPKHGLMIQLQIDSLSGELTAENDGLMWSLFPPTTIDHLMAERGFAHYYEWKGYGDIKSLYP